MNAMTFKAVRPLQAFETKREMWFIQDRDRSNTIPRYPSEWPFSITMPGMGSSDP